MFRHLTDTTKALIFYSIAFGLAVLVTLLAPLSYALGSVLLRRRPPVNPLRLTAGMFLVGQVVMAPVVLAAGSPNLDGLLGGRVIVLLVGLALLGTATPAFLNYLLIMRAGATNASLVMFLMPVIAVALGTAILGEPVSPNLFGGLACIILGSLAVTRRA